MKAEELMVGNWVMWKNKAVQVASISGIVYSFGHVDVTLAHCNESNLLETHDIKSISPIPLTFEILEKNGFDCGSKKWVLPRYQTDKYFGLVMDESGAYYFEAFHKIQFVHELQNVMRLCGIEKEFKL